MARQFLLFSIAVTAATSALASLSSSNIGLALFSLALGTSWFFLEFYKRQSIPTVFFVGFLGFTVVACLGHLPIHWILAGLCANLAAWDLSRFSKRTYKHMAMETRHKLEQRHLVKLGIVSMAGFGLAALTVSVRLPLSFVVICALIFLAFTLLRRSLLALRKQIEEENEHQA